MKTQKRRFSKKKIWISILGLLIILAAIQLYTIVYVSDIPITKPNVNHKELGNLEITKDTLHDYLKNPLGVIELGRFVVKEDRKKENSNRIEIYFERFKTTAKKPLPPIIFLAGGPGSSSTRIGRTEYFYLFRELSKYADVVLLDQRGAGKSIPNLECRNSLDLPTDVTENVKEQIFEDIIDKCEECADEFREMNIDLNAYNSYESVLDIEALRKALEYDKITLYGYSYGTELAQIYMKYFEEHVSKGVLAAPLAPDHGVKLPFEVQSQYEKMDSLIKLDKKLSKYIPDFIGLVKETHEGLKKNPKKIKIPTSDAFGDNPSTMEKRLGDIIVAFKPTIEMTLTDNHLQMMLSDRIGQDRTIQSLPSFYYNISKGSYREVGNNLRNFKRRRMPNALFFTVNAASGYSNERWQQSIKEGQNSIFSHFGVSYSRYPEVYKSFGVDKIKGMNDPVSGKTELLLIVGALDGRTPSNLTDDIANRFPNNHRITVQNTGHNRLLNNDIMNTMIRFLKDSLPSDTIVHRPIQFKPPVPYKYSMTDTLYQQIKERGIQEGINLYKKLYVDYHGINDYVFDFSENTFDDLYDILIEAKEYMNAIELMDFAIQRFPKNYLLYRNLGEAYTLAGNRNKALQYLKAALNLNFFDGKTQALKQKLE
jgi:pimeloyl-ACP methyl ester carboxylesterase